MKNAWATVDYVRESHRAAACICTHIALLTESRSKRHLSASNIHGRWKGKEEEDDCRNAGGGRIKKKLWPGEEWKKTAEMASRSGRVARIKTHFLRRAQNHASVFAEANQSILLYLIARD